MDNRFHIAALIVCGLTALGLFTEGAVVLGGFVKMRLPWGGWWIGLAASLWLFVIGCVWDWLRSKTSTNCSEKK